MSINPIVQLARTVSEIDKAQAAIADLENRMDSSLLGNTSEDQTKIRLELTKMKAYLGSLRSEESSWLAQVTEDAQSRKAQGDLAKA